MNDNYNPAQPYCEGGNFNIIATDVDPMVARNIASFYANKGESWALGMARRLRVAANDNTPAAERAARRTA